MKKGTTTKITLAVTPYEEGGIEAVIFVNGSKKRCTLNGNIITPREIGEMVAMVVEDAIGTKPVTNDSKKPEKEEPVVTEKSFIEISQEFDKLFELLFDDDDDEEEEDDDEEIDVDVHYQKALEALETMKRLGMLRLLRMLDGYTEDEDDEDEEEEDDEEEKDDIRYQEALEAMRTMKMRKMKKLEMLKLLKKLSGYSEDEDDDD